MEGLVYGLTKIRTRTRKWYQKPGNPGRLVLILVIILNFWFAKYMPISECLRAGSS